MVDVIAPVVESQAPATPAPVANITPDQPIAATETADPVASVGSSATPEPTMPVSPAPAAADSAPVATSVPDTRVAAAQRMMHAATSDRANLENQLRSLGVIPVTAQPRQAAPPAQAQHPVAVTPMEAAPRTPAAEPQAADFTLTPEEAAAIHQRYTSAATDQEATAILIQEIAKVMARQVPTVDTLSSTLLKHQPYVDGIYATLRQRVEREQTLQRSVEAANGFFQKHAPKVPIELFWAHADEASRTHPNDLPQQIMFMFEKAVASVGGLLADQTPVSRGLSTGQAAQLPGAAGSPATGMAEAAPASFVEQARRMNAGI